MLYDVIKTINDETDFCVLDRITAFDRGALT